MISVKEIDIDIQYEGYFIGEMSIIVDIDEKVKSENSWEEYSLAKKIVDLSHQHGIDNFIIRGKEPLLQKTSLISLTNFISSRLKMTIETNGGVEIPKELLIRDCVFFSLSPDIDSKDFNKQVFEKNIKLFNENKFWNFQLKFKISEMEDIKMYDNLMKEIMLPDHCNIVYQPCGKDIKETSDILIDIIDYYYENKLDVRYDVRFLPSLKQLI